MEDLRIVRTVECARRQRRAVGFSAVTVVMSLLVVGLCVRDGVGSPPEYKSFGRRQRIDHNPDQDDLMRIWVVYVGQGDGLLIQLPSRCNYDTDPTDDNTNRTERVDILIDGGSHSTGNRTLMQDFLLRLYQEPVTIEHAVITHHDADHVRGLIHMLSGDSVGVDSIYHNGLASYRRNKRGFRNSTTAKEAVRSTSGGQLTRGMAFLEDADDGHGKKLRDTDLIAGMDDLEERFNNDEFQGIYEDLAAAVIDKQNPMEVRLFQRCAESGSFDSFIGEREEALDRGVDLSGIEFELLWPLPRARKYGGWSETINGNSVTFRLDYGEFSMLFTGDMNERSEEKLIEHLGDPVSSEALDVDVMKVPHHGSWHAYEPFFRRRADGGGYVRPVLSVASMGKTGFTTSWRHPSTEVIRWLGGSHRVYHTLIHEKRFRWSDLQTRADRERMHEISHILIETDGEWFCLVEVSALDGDPADPGTVRDTRRSHGTRWISAN